MDLYTDTTVSAEIDLDGDLAFDWSPDASRIVFDAYPPSGQPADLFIAPVPTGPTEVLTDYTGSENHPSWSPDGEFVAFAYAGDIWKVSVFGGAPTRLTFHSDNWHPAWSPDGSTILFTSDRNGNADIWQVSAGGGEPTPLTTDPAEDDRACWSPDGSRIAFGSDRSGNVDIWVKSLTDNTTEPLTWHESYDSHADWSPDGSMIAFASQRTGNSDVWVIDLAQSSDSDGVDLRCRRPVLCRTYPNPFHRNTIMEFRVVEPAHHVQLSIIDAAGHSIASLIDGNCQRGIHRAVWDARDDQGNLVSPGIYFFRFGSGLHNTCRQVVFAR